MEVKTIGVLTSGGDAPGMNAAVRAVVRSAVKNGIQVKGVMEGYQGLIDGDLVDFDMGSVSGIIQRGGTLLRTARCMAFKTMDGVEKAKESCIKNGIDGLVVIGGDGSFRGAADLSRIGVPCVGIPGTIDNDISCTEYTIGYDTAMNVALECIDKLRDTIMSHNRCSIVEVMGSRAGWIALNVGIACGASFIALPEDKLPGETAEERFYRIENEIIERLENGKAQGRKHFTVVVAEAVTSLGFSSTDQMARDIMAKTGIDTRGTVLGHIQRGGNPTVRDRVAATEMGHYAVQLLKQGIGNRVVGIMNGKVDDMDIQEALKCKKTIPEELVKIAKEVSY